MFKIRLRSIRCVCFHIYTLYFFSLYIYIYVIKIASHDDHGTAVSMLVSQVSQKWSSSQRPAGSRSTKSWCLSSSSNAGKKKKKSVSAERQSAIRQEELLLSRRESAFLFYIKPKNCRDKNTEDMIRKRYEPTHWFNKCFLRLTKCRFSSVAQSCPTLCDPMNRSTPGLLAHHQLPEFT